MERIQLNFVPSWDGPLEGWCVNYINKNVWRVIPEHDKDDLYQDAFLFFLVCKERYPQVSEPPHFMALMKTCLRNHINELATRRTQRSEVKNFSAVLDDDVERTTGLIEQLGVEDDADGVDFKMMCGSAPKPFKRILIAFTQNLLEYNAVSGVRETTNGLLCRLACVEDPDLRVKFETWLVDGVLT